MRDFLRRRRGLFGVLVAAPVIVAACGVGGSEFTFVQSPDRQAFFKVPSEWEKYNKQQILVASGLSLSEATDQSLPWLLGFDGSPKPSIDNVLALSEAPDFPVLFVRSQTLDFTDRDAISLSSLRNVIYPVDDLLNDDRAAVLSYEELPPQDGFRGIRLEYDVVPEGVNTVAEGSDVIRVAQVGILDAATENLYLLAIRCESHCFRDNRTLIDQILDSWTVKER